MTLKRIGILREAEETPGLFLFAPFRNPLPISSPVWCHPERSEGSRAQPRFRRTYLPREITREVIPAAFPRLPCSNRAKPASFFILTNVQGLPLAVATAAQY